MNVQTFFAGYPSFKSYWLAQYNDELNLSEFSSDNTLLKYNASLAKSCVYLKSGQTVKLAPTPISAISPGAFIFQRPFWRGLYSEGSIYGGKFALQNRLSYLMVRR